MRRRLLLLATSLALTAAQPPLPAAAPATPPFRLGLNDVFIGNDTLTTAQQLALFKEVGAAGLRHVQPNDVHWSTVQQTNGLFTFTAADSVLASSYGFGALPTFYGNATANYYVPPGTAATNAWSAATYGPQTTTYLQTVVNRYKNAHHYWEIGNEMNAKTASPAGFSAADYAAFLIYNRNAIRAADPQAQVVIAGLLGNYSFPLSGAYQWLRDVLAAGGGAGFDVFNFHDYKSWWTLPTHYDQYRAILDANGLQATPIWVTETAQASTISNANINPAYASVDGQAADVWRRPCVLFGKGVQTVFWHSFWAGSNDTTGFHDMGLVTAATGIRKKAWHAMKLLNQKIEGFASATLVSTGVTNDDNVTGGAGVWIVRFDFADGTRRWVAWSPDNQTTTLTGLTSVATVNLTTVVPATVSADGVTATWTAATRAVNNNSLTLTLADAPVLIEVATTTTTATAPTVTTGPAPQTVTAGATVTFSVAASGTAPLTYQWFKDNVALGGATAATLTFTATAQSAGSYTVAVTNAAGTTTSSAATLTVSPATTAPAVTTGPATQTVTAGATVTFSVAASGTAPLTYQWFKDNVALSGATAATLTFTATAQSAGSYTVTVNNAAGTTTSSAATLTVNPAAYLSNLSVRTTLAAGQIVTVGLVVGNGTKPILLRAAGPALTAFNLSTAMPDPRLELYQGAAKIAENNDWPASLAPTFTALGAFTFATASKDAALLQTLGGGYTVQTSGPTAGTVLVEAYDAGPVSQARLINVSARNRAGTGADTLIAGFTIAGTGTMRVLLRAVGPTLSAFNVTEPLADPKLELFDANSAKIDENDNWAAALSSTFAAVGAFTLPTGSKDAALLTTLTAGRSYTVQVTGATGGTGEALVEIYEVP
jgi:hypothetical protein